MTAFDATQDRVCIRVVYDGIASAGKTTNLRQLAELFATQRTCEVFSPEEMDGRTVYFDWLQIAAGMVCGFPLVCQVITVPGQVVLTPRRKHLLLAADAVVYVCDSDAEAVGRAVEGMAALDAVCAQRGEPLPLVVQANKQDQATAVSGAALLAAMGRDVPVVEAIATDGIGVVDTFVAAVRGAVRALNARVEAGEVYIPVRRAETAAEALAKIADVEVDPEWAAEMLLEQAANACRIGDLEDGAPGPDDGAEHEPLDAQDPGRATGEVPPLPTEDVPTGFVWPAHTGRATLRALASQVSASEHVPLDSHGVVHRTLGDLMLSTGRDRRFDSDEAARQSLVRAARARTQLGPLLEPETALVVQRAQDGASWLWTIAPRMPTVAQLLVDGAKVESTARRVLGALGQALGDALKVVAAHGVTLDLSPSSFGVHHGVVRYLGEVAPLDVGRYDVGGAIERALAAVVELGADPEPMVGALESALAAKLSPDDAAKLARTTRWSDVGDLPVAVAGARERIEGALARARRAA